MTPRITKEELGTPENISYHVYLFTDEESCREATPKAIPTNCWCRVVMAKDTCEAIETAINGTIASHQIFLNDGEYLHVAIIPSLELGREDFKRRSVYVRIEPRYIIGEF